MSRAVLPCWRRARSGVSGGVLPRGLPGVPRRTSSPFPTLFGSRVGSARGSRAASSSRQPLLAAEATQQPALAKRFPLLVFPRPPREPLGCRWTGISSSGCSPLAGLWALVGVQDERSPLQAWPGGFLHSLLAADCGRERGPVRLQPGSARGRAPVCSSPGAGACQASKGGWRELLCVTLERRSSLGSRQDALLPAHALTVGHLLFVSLGPRFHEAESAAWETAAFPFCPRDEVTLQPEWAGGQLAS